MRLGDAKILGTVVNAQGIPQAGRSVWATWLPPGDGKAGAVVEPMQTTTDERGAFRFANVAAGRWRLETRSPRNTIVAAAIDVAQSGEARVVLTEAEGALRLRLLDTNGRSVSGAQGQALALPRASDVAGGILGTEVNSDAAGVVELPWASETVAALLLDLQLPSGAVFCTQLAVGEEDEIPTVIPTGVGLLAISFANRQQNGFPRVALTSAGGGVCDLLFHWATAPGRSMAWSTQDQRLLVRLVPGVYRLSLPPPGTSSLLQAIPSGLKTALDVEVVAGGTVTAAVP